MKVRIDYCDGRFTMIPINIGEQWIGTPIVEISDEDWQKYESFLEESHKWYEYICRLDNKWHEENK